MVSWIGAASAAATCFLAMPATAALVIVSPAGTNPATLPIVLVPLGNGQFTGGSSDQFLSEPASSTLDYTFSYTFALPTDGGGSVSFTTTSSMPSDALLSVTSVTLNSQPLTVNTTSPGMGTIVYSGSNSFSGGTAGEVLSLVFNGTVLRGGTLATSLSFSSNAGMAAVPEPASWAMMIGGFGLVGGALRRQKIRATVSFA